MYITIYGRKHRIPCVLLKIVYGHIDVGYRPWYDKYRYGLVDRVFRKYGDALYCAGEFQTDL